MKRLKGFTLVELVITIAIVIILSVVSIPIYKGYTLKAKMSEAYTLLGLCLSAQKAYYAEYGNFLGDSENKNGWSCYTEILGIDARGNKYFTFFDSSSVSNYAKTYTDMGVLIPEELRTNEALLYLHYNVTRGERFSGIGLDNSWL